MLFDELESYIARNRARGVPVWSALLSIPKKYYKYGFRLHPRNQIYGYGLYDKPLLMSYSRSGTNWVRYMIEFLSDRPTPGHTRLVDGGNYVIDRAHKGFSVINRYSKVVLLIRNYKECLVRHSLDRWKKSSSTKEFLEDRKQEQPPDWYIKNIQAFDSFKFDKLLVYYEDLVSDPENQASRIAEFLDIQNDNLSDFQNNIDYHRKRSVSYYGENQRSLTGGDTAKLNHHSARNLTIEQSREFDVYYLTNFSGIYQKYLLRYKSKA